MLISGSKVTFKTVLISDIGSRISDLTTFSEI